MLTLAAALPTVALPERDMSGILILLAATALFGAAVAFALTRFGVDSMGAFILGCVAAGGVAVVISLGVGDPTTDWTELAVTASETHWDIDWSNTASFDRARGTTFTAPARVDGAWTECTLTLLDTDIAGATHEVLVLCSDQTAEPPLRNN